MQTIRSVFLGSSRGSGNSADPAPPSGAIALRAKKRLNHAKIRGAEDRDRHER
jgi:hypothetical protein